MPPLPYPKHSTPGVLPGEGEGRRINGYIEKDGDLDRVRRSAGLVAVVDTGKTGIRGQLLVGDVRYIVYTGSVVAVSATNVVTTLSGTVAGSDQVTLARNNRVTGGASTPDIVCVRQDGGAYILTSSAVSAYPDADLPATVNSVDFMGGYFIFTIPDGRVIASELNSTDIEALSFTSAESRSDGLRRGIVVGSIYYAMGGSTIEPYQNVGTSPFPLQRAATVIPVGIVATAAIAGAQEGWDKSPIFVAVDGTVRMLSGYETQIISTPPVERFIASATPALLDCGVYTVRGHAFWSVSAGSVTWEYNLTSQAWSERQSGASRWRASKAVKIGTAWIAGDALSGNLLRIDDSLRTELGTAMTWTVESGALKEFPNRFAAPSLFLEFTKGVGASAAITYSIDGGTTWLGPFNRMLDDCDKRPARVNRLGLSTQHGVRVRAVVTSGVDFSFAGGSLESLVPAAP